jgi:hypothetical protein
MKGGEASGQANGTSETMPPMPGAAGGAASAALEKLMGAMPTTAAQTGGRRRRGSKRSGSKRRYSKKGGNGVIATAAVPFGLLALQRYFKGSRTSKKGVRNMGNSFKRTFRRRR